jgi:hypothetical protein
MTGMDRIQIESVVPIVVNRLSTKAERRLRLVFSVDDLLNPPTADHDRLGLLRGFTELIESIAQLVESVGQEGLQHLEIFERIFFCGISFSRKSLRIGVGLCWKNKSISLCSYYSNYLTKYLVDVNQYGTVTDILVVAT